MDSCLVRMSTRCLSSCSENGSLPPPEPVPETAGGSRVERKEHEIQSKDLSVSLSSATFSSPSPTSTPLDFSELQFQIHNYWVKWHSDYKRIPTNAKHSAKVRLTQMPRLCARPKSTGSTWGKHMNNRRKVHSFSFFSEPKFIHCLHGIDLGSSSFLRDFKLLEISDLSLL